MLGLLAAAPIFSLTSWLTLTKIESRQNVPECHSLSVFPKEFIDAGLCFTQVAVYGSLSNVSTTRKAATDISRRANELILCITAAALIFPGCIYKTKALRKQVSRYQGDGVITDTSLTVFPLVRIPGYRIDFPGFDQNSPNQSTYTFKGVPKTRGAESVIYVRFPGRYSPDLDEIKKSVTSVLSYTVLDQSGTVLTTQEIVFSNAWWSGSWDTFALWVQKPGDYGAQNTFYFDPTNGYTLRVKYEPGTPPATTNMFISIENGGHI